MQQYISLRLSVILFFLILLLSVLHVKKNIPNLSSFWVKDEKLTETLTEIRQIYSSLISSVV